MRIERLGPGDAAVAIATYRAAGAAGPEPTVVLDWTFDDARNE